MAEATTVRVGVAGTRASRPVVQVALEECERRGAHLQLVHGWTAPVGGGERGRHVERVVAARHRNEMLTELHDLLAEHPSVSVGVEAPHRGAGVSVVGEPSLTALVIMGRHHDPAAPPGALGPNVEDTLRWSPVPVTVVDPTPAEVDSRQAVGQ